jgi:hypothetical protein
MFFVQKDIDITNLCNFLVTKRINNIEKFIYLIAFIFAISSGLLLWHAFGPLVFLDQKLMGFFC